MVLWVIQCTHFPCSWKPFEGSFRRWNYWRGVRWERRCSGGGGNLFPGGIIQCVRVCEKTDETEPSECCVFRKQRLCCHGQHDDCDGVRHDHLVSGVTEPETNRLWWSPVSDVTDLPIYCLLWSPGFWRNRPSQVYCLWWSAGFWRNCPSNLLWGDHPASDVTQPQIYRLWWSPGFLAHQNTHPLTHSYGSHRQQTLGVTFPSIQSWCLELNCCFLLVKDVVMLSTDVDFLRNKAFGEIHTKAWYFPKHIIVGLLVFVQLQ